MPFDDLFALLAKQQAHEKRQREALFDSMYPPPGETLDEEDEEESTPDDEDLAGACK